MIDEHFKQTPNLYNVLCQIEVECLGMELSKDDFGNYIGKALKLNLLGQGSSRNVYSLNDKYVLKTPTATYGFYNGLQSNLVEYLIYRRFGKVLPLAPCKIFFYENIPVLLMKKLERVSSYSTLKALSGFCDGYSQLGKTKWGKKLCYDYGYEYSYAIRTMDPKVFDLTNEEMMKIVRRNPSLKKCSHVLFPQYKALAV